MRATIERATLLKSLSHVQSVVERRNTIPILSNVLIEASEGGKIKLTATDLDLQVVETFAADVETPGATTVSAHTLFEIARKLPEGSQVQLHAADGRMAVNAGRARFEQRGGVTARAEGRIDDGHAGARGDRGDHLVEQHGDVGGILRHHAALPFLAPAISFSQAACALFHSGPISFNCCGAQTKKKSPAAWK